MRLSPRVQAAFAIVMREQTDSWGKTMVRLFRSFFMISFVTALFGLFMVTVVHVMTNQSPSFAKLPEPTAFILQTNNS